MIYGPIRAPVFWQDACRTLGHNVCKLLTLAGEEVTPSGIINVVGSLPELSADIGLDRFKESKLNLALKTAWERAANSAEQSNAKDLADYFLEYIPAQGMSAVVLMKDSFSGVISGLDYEY